MKIMKRLNRDYDGKTGDRKTEMKEWDRKMNLRMVTICDCKCWRQALVKWEDLK